jgi:hypothetical protein
MLEKKSDYDKNISKNSLFWYIFILKYCIIKNSIKNNNFNGKLTHEEAASKNSLSQAGNTTVQNLIPTTQSTT